MEDYILREIDKIGALLAGLLRKAGLLKASDTPQTVRQAARTELLEQLDLDVDTLLTHEDFIRELTDRYGFTEEHLDRFAELLFDFVAASEDRPERLRLAAAIGAIYSYLDRRKAPVSVNRYYILKDLNEYIQ